MPRQSPPRVRNVPTHRSKLGPPELIDEVLDTVRLEIAHCAARAQDHARLIESTGTLACDITVEIYRDAAPHDLIQRAHGIQSLVLRGMNLLAELLSEAGRLESLAGIKGAADDSEHRW